MEGKKPTTLQYKKNNQYKKSYWLFATDYLYLHPQNNMLAR
jgi:hypothetical protein